MAGGFRRRVTVRTVSVVALAVLVDPVGAVQAQNVPTDQEIEEAREAQRHAAEVVAEAQARLDALAAELDGARVRAATAIEEYNGARVESSRARQAAEAAVGEAAGVRNEHTAADVELGRMAAATYRSGGGWSELGVVVNIATDASIISVSDALATLTRSQSAVQGRWAAVLDEAESAVREAERQVAERAETERAAERTLELAAQAVAEHEEAVARVAQRRDELIAQLATARGTTAELEGERQRAAERREQAQREQAERRRAEQEQRQEARRTQGEPEREQAEQDSAERRPAEQEQAEQEQAEQEQRDQVEPDAEAEPAESGSGGAVDEAGAGDEPAESVAGGSAAQRAIDYARAQIGKPYVLAGAGPVGFDCSGLTMRAWETGGVQLTHWSVAQARQTEPVSYSDLRPGDLIFWSSDGAPSGTYHVALYIGGGEMIHAPSPGGYVEIRHVFYWRTPSFYSRVSG